MVGAIEETSISQAQALFDTNVIGVLRTIQAVLPGMRRQRAGLIVNISSILGFMPAPFMGIYASTKHAIEGLSESLDHEVRAFGIRAVLIDTRTSSLRESNMLDFIGMVITAALILLVVNALTTFMDVSRVAKITLAALIEVWIGMAAAAAGAPDHVAQLVDEVRIFESLNCR